MKNVIELLNEIQDIVYGQDEIIKELISAIYAHFNIVEATSFADNRNILLIGESGTGKTFLVETLCEHLGIPFVYVDATRLTQTGYAGSKIEEAYVQLLIKCNGNLAKAEKSIVFIDEFDKLCDNNSSFYQNDIGSIGVQYELLKAFENSDIKIDYNGQTILFNTSKIINICAGAFYNVNIKDNDILKLKDSGLITELFGRFTNIIKMNSYSYNDFYKLIKNNSLTVIKKYSSLFNNKNCINFTETEIDDIINKALKAGTNIRAIEYEVEKKLNSLYIDFLFKNHI